MKKARLILRILFGIMFLLTAAGLVYVATSLMSAASEDKLLIVIAPIFVIIFIFPLMIAEAELFFFFRPREKKKRGIADIATAILSLAIISLTAVWFIFRSNYLHDMFFASSGLFWIIYIPFKICKAVRSIRKAWS